MTRDAFEIWSRHACISANVWIDNPRSCAVNCFTYAVTAALRAHSNPEPEGQFYHEQEAILLRKTLHGVLGDSLDAAAAAATRGEMVNVMRDMLRGLAVGNLILPETGNVVAALHDVTLFVLAEEKLAGKDRDQKRTLFASKYGECWL